MVLETKKKSVKVQKNLMLLEGALKVTLVILLQKKKLKHFVSKEALNIDGLGKKVIEQFWDLNFIKEPSEIF